MAFFTDRICRVFLSPESLHKKRRIWQVQALNHSIDESLSSGQPRYVTASVTGCGGKHISSCRPLIESDADVMDSLVKDILNKERPSPLILGVAKSKLNDTNDDRNEIYLHLAIPSTTTDHENDNDNEEISFDRIVLLPLSSFTQKLAKAFEQQLTSTALCFVADASSAIGTQVIGEVVTTCNAGLVLIREPGWMTSLAYLSEQNLISTSKIERIIFSLCRLEAWRVRKHIGKSRTVVFTLPGQSSTAPLLPHLQKVFPCERHVFVYDGCVDSTSRASRIKNTTTSYQPTNTSPKTDNTPIMSPSLPRSITATTPISPLTSIRDYSSFLSPLSSQQAAAVEAWMSSVDVFLTLKDNERESGYLPFVCRMGYLFADTGRLGNGAVDQSQLALTNLLQYITGSRSRPLEDHVFKAAKVTLMVCRHAEKEDTEKYGKMVSEAERVAIEACVFSHKGILIGDKTLLDTVQPKKDWSLKAAKKLTSCSCCAPEDEDEEEEAGQEEENRLKRIDETGMSTSSGGGASFIPNMAKSQYVDGKSAFAFDPSKFSGM